MKTQIIFTSLSMAASLATVESFYVPARKPASSSSSRLGLKNLSKKLMQEKKEHQHESNDPTANDIAGRFMSFAAQSPKPLTTSYSWKKEDDTTKEQEEPSTDVSSISLQETASSTGYDEYAMPTPNTEEWLTALAELEDRLEQTKLSHTQVWGAESSVQTPRSIHDDSEGCWQ
ncbi:unnamed protein product [Cylindrotheca closterium]|uniref:Uncharacterized protein n=1 Tax=Cylindrotheca closterium TaxID=2856 RepID=A0AAD2G2L5_9STRA|nr:unnamed protein product [Cylindrotheca closterium]